MKPIGSETKLVALFGYPARHSISPTIHNAAFKHLELDYRYVVFTVEPGDLEAAIAGVRAMGMAGVNLTLPHKLHVIPLLDEMDPEASFIGAVNTIVNSAGRLKGYNTDGRGFMRSLKEKGIDVGGKEVLVLGAGGAARAISYYLAKEAGKLRIYNRTPERAIKLADDLAARGDVAAVDSLDGAGSADIVINATSLGLSKSDPLPIEPSLLGKDTVVADLIYFKTPLLRAASERGAVTLSGTGMLLWQGALAFELWTGMTPPVGIMRASLE